MVKDYRLCSMRFNLLKEDGEEWVDPSVKEIGILTHNRVEISTVFHCDGLLLCVTTDKSCLIVWNPYLGQTRWITKKTTVEPKYALGCDKNKNHKILRYFGIVNYYYQIYDFKSDSWRVLNINNENTYLSWPGTTLDGNTYFLTRKGGYMLCFDFTTERFGQLLSLPFENLNDGSVQLSCVKEEKLALFFQNDETFTVDIWITSKIEPTAVSWTPFLVNIIETPVGLEFDEECSFFIDEAKKLAVVFDLYKTDTTSSYIIGENGFLKEMNLGGTKYQYHFPSSVQINQIASCKGGENKRKSQF